MKFPQRIIDLFWGQSGSGKSDAIRLLLQEWLKQNPDQIARVVIGDGSLATYDHLIEKGRVEAVEFTQRDQPVDVVAKITEGWFPIDGDINGDLVEPAKQPNFSKVGFYVFEGASVMGSYIMSNIKGGLADLAGKGHQFGQPTPFQIPQGEFDEKGNLKPGGRNYGGNPPSHYGIGQRHVVDAVNRSKRLAPIVIWTAHEYTNDPTTSQTVKELLVGPEVVGKQLTSSFQKLFGGSYHFQTIATKSKVMDEATKKDRTELDLDFRIWTRDHFSPDNNTMIRYKALVRGVRGMKEYYNDIRDLYTDLATLKEQEGIDN